MRQGAIEPVRQTDEREQQAPFRVATGRVPVALDAAPVVLEVRPRPQVPVALLLQLESQLIDRTSRSRFFPL